MRIDEGIARIFTTLFHPLIMPTLSYFVLFQLNTFVSFAVSAEAKRFIMVIVFINTAVLPALAIWIMKKTGYVTDYMLSERSERLLPLFLASALFFITHYMLRQVSLPSLVNFYMISATLLVLLTLIISFVWKISIHMVALGGFSGFLIITSLFLRLDIAWLIAAAFLVSGITGSARLVLKAHTPAQVYVGYLLGLLVMIGLFFYFRG